MSDNKNVPEIRFEGFDELWMKNSFSEIASRQTVISQNLKYPRVEFEDIVSKEGRLNKNIWMKNSSKVGIRFDREDVLFGKLRPYLKNWYFPMFEGIAVGDFWVLRANDVSSRFLYHLIQTIRFERAANLSSGSKMPRSDWGLVSATLFKIPQRIKEQQKIGFYFQDLDKLITQHQNKHNQLVNLKRAMLEKMFPKEGSNAPEVRFEGFLGKWREQPLSNSVSITTGRLDANAMKEDGKYDFYTSGINKYKIDIAAFEGPAITIAGNGATVGYMHLANGKFNAYQRTYVLTEFKDNRDFLYATIGKILPLKISQEARMGNIPYIVLDMLTDLKIVLPSKNEQEKIGAYFKNLDNLIALQKQQLEKLKNLKKACLDKMFV